MSLVCRTPKPGPVGNLRGKRLQFKTRKKVIARLGRGGLLSEGGFWRIHTVRSLPAFLHVHSSFGGGSYYPPRFAQEQAEAQGGDISCPISQISNFQPFSSPGTQKLSTKILHTPKKMHFLPI